MIKHDGKCDHHLLPAIKLKEMKKILFVAFFMLIFLGNSYGQEYCENFKIVSIFDIPPTPQTPGGNYFLLLLTIEEDNIKNLDNYANLFFVDELGDTISIPTGSKSTLPIYAIDTIPYILQLNSTSSNQDFPEEFNGELVIIQFSQPVCEVPYSNVSTSTNIIQNVLEIDVYPNPFVDCIKIESNNRIDNIMIFNSIGDFVESFRPKLNSFDMNLEKLKPGGYFIAIKFENGETLVNKILKM